jgi:hypothetical protein
LHSLCTSVKIFQFEPSFFPHFFQP